MPHAKTRSKFQILFSATTPGRFEWFRFWWRFSQDAERRLFQTRTGPVIKNIANDLIDLAIEQPQGDIGRAGLFAQSAVNAAAGHMNRPHQMEDRNFRGQISCLDKLRVLQTAFLAKTNRADIAATVTLDAPLKFIHPARKAPLLIIVLKILDIILVIDTDLLFMKSGFGRF
jgi:hypothetical protein